MRALVVAVVIGACHPVPDGITDVGLDAMADEPDAAPPPSRDLRNPINAGPDPFITFHDGNYYLATTQGDALRIWKAPSLGRLAVAEPITVWQDSDPSRNQHIWAPSFYLIDGHWYLYYTADDGIDEHHRIYALESAGTDPLGPYHFKAKLEAPNALGRWAIDPEILEQGGNRYLVWSGAGTQGHNLIYIAPLSNPWTVSGPRIYLNAAGGCAEVREAPAILQRGGTTRLVYSSCDTGKPDYQLHMLTIPTTSDPMLAASWSQYPIPMLRSKPELGVFGPGSCAFFQSPDGTEDWIVYHAKNTSQFTYDGRTTRAQRLEGGTVNFGTPVSANGAHALPSGDPGLGTHAINDGEATYTGSWSYYSTCGNQCLYGDDHGSVERGATATYSFTGTQIAFYAVRDAGNGIAAFSLDGGPETMRDTYAAIRQGAQPIYVSPKLDPGVHQLRVRVTGDHVAGSAGAAISIDRAEVYVD
jgi:GH43 family beta-xylosidase